MSSPAPASKASRALEKSAESASEQLAKHRWHWTLDETNPERVSLRAYARDVGRAESIVRKYANSYADWTAHPDVRTLPEIRAIRICLATAYDGRADAQQSHRFAPLPTS